MKVPFTITFLLFLSVSFCQNKKPIYVDTLNGDLMTGNSKKFVSSTIIIKHITQANQNKVLLLSRYIDTTKEILIVFGGDTSYTTIKNLRSGKEVIFIDNYVIPKLYFNKNHFYFSCTVFNINGDYEAKIEENKLLPSECEEYGSSNWIEVINKKEIPILQVLLDKKTNSININGLFFTNQTYVLLSDSGMFVRPFKQPFQLMTAEDKNKALYRAISEAKKYLTPLHEIKN